MAREFNPEYLAVLALARDPQKQPGKDDIFVIKLDLQLYPIEEAVRQAMR